MQALTAHTAVTRLDVSGAVVTAMCVSTSTFAEPLASWPRLCSLRLARPDAAAPELRPGAAANIWAPALAHASALTALDISRVCINVQLARAIGALTHLPELRVTSCDGARDLFPHIASLSRLRLLCAERAGTSWLLGPAVNASIRTFKSLLYLNLAHALEDAADLELAALPQLEALHLRGCVLAIDSSLILPERTARTFAKDDPACRYSVRALPHLLQLTALSCGDATASGAHEALASALGAVLPLLPRLAQLEIMVIEQAVADEHSPVGGRTHPRCVHSDASSLQVQRLLHGTAQAAIRLSGLTSLDILIQNGAISAGWGF